MNQRALVRASGYTPQSLSWLWQDYIPLKAVTAVEGDPGDGKSTVVYDLAARITTGRPMPFSDAAAEPAGVVLLQAEDLLRETVRPALDAAGADASRIVVYDRARFLKQPFVLGKDIGLIEDAIDLVKAKAVFLDPFSEFSGHSGNSEIAVRRTLGALATLAEKKEVAIVIVRHLAKHRSSNLKRSGLGSIGITAAARSVLVVLPDPSSNNVHQRILANAKSNLSDAKPLTYRTFRTNGVITVEWLEESDHPVGELMDVAANKFEHSQLDEACYVLYSILAKQGGPMPATEVKRKAAEALVSERTLKRAKGKLNVASRREQTRDKTTGAENIQWVWLLPKEEDVLRPYKERTIREGTASASEAEEESDSVVDVVPLPMTSSVQESSGLQDASDWVRSNRPWDD